MAVDVRKKPRDNNQIVFLSFAQNATWWCGRVIKITRENENSKWNSTAKEKIFFTTEDKNKRDVLQQILLVENDQIVVLGNYLTLFDADLNQLKQVQISLANDRYFITTCVRPRFGYQEMIQNDDTADLFLVCVWPD